MRIGSLFSGAGLCDLGFHRAGFSHQFFCEADTYCRRVLARHWPGVPIYNDVKDISGQELPAIDVLSGGFPCQDVSCGGKRAGITNTTRSGLWYEYRRIISNIRPRYVIIENVKGLLSKGMDTVLQDLSAIGYDADWQCLSAAAFGAPHLRERIFIVAYPHGQRADTAHGVLASLGRNIPEHIQHDSISNWLGVRIDRASRETIRQPYGGRVLHRVDDGRADALDGIGGLGSRPPYNVGTISKAKRLEWLPRLKALGNGILPIQAFAVACCILQAEGLPLPQWTDN